MKKSQGFTLLELLLYSGVAAGLLGVAFAFQLTFFKSNATTQSVDSIIQARADIDRLVQSQLVTAKNINNPATDNTSDDFLELIDAQDRVIKLSLSDGGLFFQITSPTVEPPLRATSPDVNVDSIDFRRVNNNFSDGVRYTVRIRPSNSKSTLGGNLSTTHTNSEVLFR